MEDGRRMSVLQRALLQRRVRVALCVFLRMADSWGGGVSDSDYSTRSRSLEEQGLFQESDTVDGIGITSL